MNAAELPGPQDPRAQMERLDGLLAAETEEEKIRAGMGIRLALGLAQELKDGKPFGTDTGELVAAWMHDYGKDTVDAAVTVAREFLTKPEAMRMALGQRLQGAARASQDGGDEAGTGDDTGGMEPGDYVENADAGDTEDGRE